MLRCCEDILRGLDNELRSIDEVLKNKIGVRRLSDYLAADSTQEALGRLDGRRDNIEAAVSRISQDATRRRCLALAQEHAQYHRNDPDERRFWSELADIFGG